MPIMNKWYEFQTFLTDIKKVIQIYTNTHAYFHKFRSESFLLIKLYTYLMHMSCIQSKSIYLTKSWWKAECDNSHAHTYTHV